MQVNAAIFKAYDIRGIVPTTLNTEVAEALGLAPNTLSFHLKELVHAELVSQERVGRNLIYRARFERMNAVLAYLTDNCCQGQPCAASSASTACPC